MTPLSELLAQLEAAVRAGDRARAFDLARQIAQQLVREHHAQAVTERRVRELLAELDRPPAGTRAIAPQVLMTERGGLEGAATQGEVFPVWFGTNRKPAAQGNGFTGERHSRVTRGRVDVYIPEAHRFGETGSSFWTKLKRFDLRDDTLRVQKVTAQDRDDFFAEIKSAMQTARESGETPHAVVFLHGFNVTFEDAAIRAAQIGCDLKVPGATAFFSWPSRGSVAAYPADEASIEASEGAITEFLVDFAANCGAEKIHIISHSMQRCPCYQASGGGVKGLGRASEAYPRVGLREVCGRLPGDESGVAGHLRPRNMLDRGLCRKKSGPDAFLS